jgi:hypothetical protein
MNEILLTVTMACMSANLALLPVPAWPLMCIGPPYQWTTDSHSEWHASGPEIWCPLPNDGVDIDWHDCRVWPTRGRSAHKHLDYYLDEFTFRFNRRRSKSRGKLFFRLV